MSTEEQNTSNAASTSGAPSTSDAGTVAPEETIKISLRTSDGEVFELDEKIAMEFKTVKAFFEDEGVSREMLMPIPNVHSRELVKIITFCTKAIALMPKDDANVDPKAKDQLKQFHREFLKDESTELAMEMILAADYLNIDYMLEALNQCVADRIKNKSVEYVRRLFGVQSDYTMEEEKQIREEYAWAFEGVDED